MSFFKSRFVVGITFWVACFWCDPSANAFHQPTLRFSVQRRQQEAHRMLRKVTHHCPCIDGVAICRLPSTTGSISYSSSSSSHHATARSNEEGTSSFLHNIPERIVMGLWKGLTLPFPALRKVMGNTGGRKSKQRGRSSKMAIGLSFREGFFILASYLTLGALVYHSLLEKEWTLVDSIYFTVTLFTSVGYGDLCPSSVASKMFTCFFGFGGIAFLGTAVATISSRLVEAEVEAIEKARQTTKKRIMQVFEGLPKVVPRLKTKDAPKTKQRPTFSTEVRRISVRNQVFRLVRTFGIILGGGTIVGYLNGGWGLADSLYYSLVTASTIGLGDFSPQTREARIFAIYYIPFAVAAAGDFLSGIALDLVQHRQRLVYKTQLEEDLTIEHLNAMDADGDGKITPDEYIRFMLIEMGRVDPKEINELLMQFKRLDVTHSGYLDNEDLKLMATYRGAKVL